MAVASHISHSVYVENMTMTFFNFTLFSMLSVFMTKETYLMLLEKQICP